MKAGLVVTVLAIFLYGCVSGPAVNEDNITNKTKIRNESKKEIEGIVMKKEIKYDVEDERERRLRAKSFGIFNFSVLNEDNCLDYYDAYKVKISELKDDIKTEEPELKREQTDVNKAKQEYQEALESGNENAAKNKKDALDQEEDEFTEQEDKVEDLNELLAKLLIITKEMDKECKRLKAVN